MMHKGKILPFSEVATIKRAIDSSHRKEAKQRRVKEELNRVDLSSLIGSENG